MADYSSDLVRAVATAIGMAMTTRHTTEEIARAALEAAAFPHLEPSHFPHIYLSTSCLHGKHDYCRSQTGSNGEQVWVKKPSSCKFCSAPCICSCHA